MPWSLTQPRQRRRLCSGCRFVSLGRASRASKQASPRTAEQLELARSNAAAFTPETLDLSRFKASPFIARQLCTAKFVYVRDDRLGKPSLAPRYSGLFRVLEKNWEKNNFWIDLGKKEDCVSLSRLKAASVPEGATWGRCWGEGYCTDKSPMRFIRLRGYDLFFKSVFCIYFTYISDSEL